MQLLRYSNEKYHQTMLVITHDENIALQADRILELENEVFVSWPREDVARYLDLTERFLLSLREKTKAL